MAFELRKRGATFADIAKQLGYSNHTAAMKAVTAALDRIPNPDAQPLRKIYNERYETLLLAVFDAASNPNHKNHQQALSSALKLLGQLQRLHGCEVQPDPKKQQFEHNIIGTGAGGAVSIEAVFKVLPPERRTEILEAMAKGKGPPEEGFVDLAQQGSLVWAPALPEIAPSPNVSPPVTHPPA